MGDPGAGARISGLDVFSTEIALDSHRQFVVVDYANDPVGFRLRSRVREGVPDAVTRQAAGAIAARIAADGGGPRP